MTDHRSLSGFPRFHATHCPAQVGFHCHRQPTDWQRRILSPLVAVVVRGRCRRNFARRATASSRFPATCRRQIFRAESEARWLRRHVPPIAWARPPPVAVARTSAPRARKREPTTALTPPCVALIYAPLLPAPPRHQLNSPVRG
jgi:hypothetical protein